MADAIDPKYLDKRTQDRYLRSGQLDEKTLDKHLKSLPDVAEKSSQVATLMDADEEEEIPQEAAEAEPEDEGEDEDDGAA